MIELLSTKEQRHLNLIETLGRLEDWITISELATLLQYSERAVNNDWSALRKYTEIYSLESSHLGIRLRFNEGSGLQSVYQRIL